MKRLYIISIVALFALGFSWANDFVINLTPNNQSGISGSIVDFNISATNNTGFGVFVTQSFPTEIKYKNANILPINNPALALGLETTPRWSLLSGQNLNLSVQADVIAQSFPVLNLVANLVDSSFAVLTSGVANVSPIADLIVQKSMVGSSPQITGDNVTYDIVVRNIGSAIATGINLVDVWPNNVVTFPNIGLVDGIIGIPTIYNSLPNNYIFSINDLNPGVSANVQITGTMDSMFPAGQTFVNQAFVLTESTQYSTTNDDDSITNTVRGMSNLFVNTTIVGPSPSFVGDMITYVLDYGNNGLEDANNVVLQHILPLNFVFEEASLVPETQNGNIISWNLGSIVSGQNDQIILTGRFVGGTPVGSSFVSHTQINTPDWESDNSDDIQIITGYLLSLPEMGIQIYANNLTDPFRNTNTGQNILAISGDNVQLEIVLVNSGNVGLTGDVGLNAISGFVGYAGNTQWTVFLDPGMSKTIIITGLVGPQNFVEFNPTVNLLYSGINIDASVLISEQSICGDGLITQNEQCDTNGQIGDMLPGQSCIEENGQCILRTDNITNTVCMDYITNMGTGKQCMNVTIDYQETEITNAMCNVISSPSNTIVVGSNDQGSMNFTCTSKNNVIANQIKIDCGNGNIGTLNGVSSFTHACNYVYSPSIGIIGNTYNVRCYVDNDTRDECLSSVRVNEGYYGICGDGQLDAGEDCDLGSNIGNRVRIGNYLDLNQDYLAGMYGNGDYYCQNCRIREDETNAFAYQPPQCLGTNTTISVMENELMPFWWRLWDRQEQLVRSDYNCSDIGNNENRTIINKDSMKCTFAVYDGDAHQQLDDNPLNTFVTDCYEQDNSIMFKYFENAYKIDFDKVSGRYVYSPSYMFGSNVNTYGEYKLVLEKIDYSYCNPVSKSWEAGRTYQGVCEVNFAFTRPYIMQISTFGVDPVATTASDFLKDFYDMKGNNLIESTDINDTIALTSASYGFDSSVVSQMDEFKKKYEPLAITVDNKFKVRGNKTVGDLFDNGVIKKVPNQLIFFVKGHGQLILKQLTEFFPETPFTIYVEGMDVLVEGSIVTNGMIITDGKVSFEDDRSKGYCEVGGQVVNGIFVARGGFDSVRRTRNLDKNQERCPWGNLHVKGVLIGDGIENLLNNRRSHLNDWFNVNSNLELFIKRERKNEIFQGAALLIEYNPTLWTKLPPGADSFTKTLDVYRE